jgi:hypothetical protein
VALTGEELQASVEVYDFRPQDWIALFRTMADNWRGWNGAAEHESIEGHISVSCMHDGKGHIEMRVQLRGDMSGSAWRAEDSIYIEAGQLDALAAAAEEYFGQLKND